MTTKLSKNKYQNWWKHTRWKLFNYISRHQNSLRVLPQPQKQPTRAQKKVKNDPKTKSKSNVRIIGNIKKNESCSMTWVDPKTVDEPYSYPQTSPLRPKKDKNDPKYKSNSNVRFKGIIENESCSMTWVDPETVIELHMNSKLAH